MVKLEISFDVVSDWMFLLICKMFLFEFCVI